MSAPGLSSNAPGGFLPPVRTAGTSAAAIGDRLAESFNRSKGSQLPRSAPSPAGPPAHALPPLSHLQESSGSGIKDGTYSLGTLLGVPDKAPTVVSEDDVFDDEGDFHPGEFLRNLPEGIVEARSGPSLAAAALSTMLLKK